LYLVQLRQTTNKTMATVSRILGRSAPVFAARAPRWTAARVESRCRGAPSAFRWRAGKERSFSQSSLWRSVAAPTVSRGDSKIFKSADEAVADVQSGSVLLSSGFGLCGVACESSHHQPSIHQNRLPGRRLAAKTTSCHHQQRSSRRSAVGGLNLYTPSRPCQIMRAPKAGEAWPS